MGNSQTTEPLPSIDEEKQQEEEHDEFMCNMCTKNIPYNPLLKPNELLNTCSLECENGFKLYRDLFYKIFPKTKNVTKNDVKSMFEEYGFLIHNLLIEFQKHIYTNHLEFYKQLEVFYKLKSTTNVMYNKIPVTARINTMATMALLWKISLTL